MHRAQETSHEHHCDRHIETDGGPARERPSPLKDRSWHVDPTIWTLDESRWRPKDTWPDAFCLEVGRRLLLAQLESSEWVMRRVERVSFERDRSTNRRISIDLTVHHEAPVFVDSDGHRLFLIPLSVMRRRTLVNLELQDEEQRSIPMPGIRLNQQLDQSMLLAAAATDRKLTDSDWPDVRAFVKTFVSGQFPLVEKRIHEFDEPSEDEGQWLDKLRCNALFRATFDNLRKNFTLYVFLDETTGRRRLLTMSFDEPMNWNYQRPAWRQETDGVHYAPGWRVPWWEPTHILAGLALRSTRVRLQIPSAEYAASYHVEVAAPAGVRVVQAALLAGRPNDPERHVSIDHIIGHAPTVGLHAIEIPNGSLCRLQLDLRVPSRGWLSIVLLGALAIAGMQAALYWEWSANGASWARDELAAIVLLLATVSAAVIALVAQQEFKGVAARMVTRVRAVGVTLTALPIASAMLLVFGSLGERPLKHVSASDVILSFPHEGALLLGAFILASILCVLVLVAWLGSWRDDRRTVLKESPWDMTTEEPRDDTPSNYNEAIERYGFNAPAVGVRSSEGWREIYNWCDSRQYEAVMGLSPSRFWEALTVERRIDLSEMCARHDDFRRCAGLCRAPVGMAMSDEPVTAEASGEPTRHVDDVEPLVAVPRSGGPLGRSSDDSVAGEPPDPALDGGPQQREP